MERLHPSAYRATRLIAVPGPIGPNRPGPLRLLGEGPRHLASITWIGTNPVSARSPPREASACFRTRGRTCRDRPPRGAPFDTASLLRPPSAERIEPAA